MELKCVCHDCLPAPFCLLFNFALFSFLHFCILDVEARAFCGMMCSEVDVARVQTDATLCHRRFAALFRINLSSKQLRSFVHHTWSWWLLFCTNTSTSCWMESAKLHSRFAFWQIVVLQPVCQCAIDMPRKSHTSAHEPTQDFTMDSGTTSKNDNNTQRLWINTIARAIINFEQCRWWFQSWYFIIYFYFYSVCVCVSEWWMHYNDKSFDRFGYNRNKISEIWKTCVVCYWWRHTVCRTVAIQFDWILFFFFLLLLLWRARQAKNYKFNRRLVLVWCSIMTLDTMCS